jgi:predicted flap endonuclease-1-like 5' DNA nuclease
MADQPLPDDNKPLTPLGYMQESLSVWRDFSKRSAKIMMGQMGNFAARPSVKEDTDTAASELFRTMADMNLRHWQNTARLLDSMPAWMKTPNNMSGSAMVDWFDRIRRNNGAFAYVQDTAVAPQAVASTKQPTALSTPQGNADDLTRIKGIGHKLSALLNELGIYHFKQIASWSQPEAAWVDEFLAFKGRVSRENWIEQARTFSSNGAATLH